MIVMYVKGSRQKVNVQLCIQVHNPERLLITRSSTCSALTLQETTPLIGDVELMMEEYCSRTKAWKWVKRFSALNKTTRE